MSNHSRQSGQDNKPIPTTNIIGQTNIPARNSVSPQLHQSQSQINNRVPLPASIQNQESNLQRSSTQAQIQHASPVMNANYLKSLQLANMKKQQGPTPVNNSPMGIKRTDSTTSQSRPIPFQPKSSINQHSYTSPKTNVVAQQQIQARALPAQNTLNTTPSYAPILQQQIQDMNIPPLTPPGSFTSSVPSQTKDLLQFLKMVQLGKEGQQQDPSNRPRSTPPKTVNDSNNAAFNELNMQKLSNSADRPNYNYNPALISGTQQM
ncbi:MAG: hypothetical protein EZS28_030930, partial [Streblomastix strix]